MCEDWQIYRQDGATGVKSRTSNKLSKDINDQQAGQYYSQRENANKQRTEDINCHDEI